MRIDTVNCQEQKTLSDNGNELVTSKMNMKESKSDDKKTLKDTEKCEEDNDVQKREEETSFASNMVTKPMDENVRNCECMSNKNEAKKCENNEISMRKVSESIAEIKNKDFMQKNERKMKRNNG